MPRTHYLHDEKVHYKWDTDNEPVLTIEAVFTSAPASTSGAGSNGARVPASATA
jgi:hypothetical protein